MDKRQNGPPTCQHFSSPASLQVSCGDGSPKGLDKANHSQGWLLHFGGEDAFKQGDLIVSAFDDGVIKEGVGVTIARCKDDGVDGLKHGAILKHSRGLCKLLHAGLDGHSATQDAGWELVIEHRLFPQGAVQKQETKTLGVIYLNSKKYLQQFIALEPNLRG